MNPAFSPDALYGPLTKQTNPPLSRYRDALYGAPGASQSPLTGFYGDRTPCVSGI